MISEVASNPLIEGVVAIDIAREALMALPWSREASRELERLDDQRAMLFARPYAIVYAALADGAAKDEQ